MRIRKNMKPDQVMVNVAGRPLAAYKHWMCSSVWSADPGPEAYIRIRQPARRRIHLPISKAEVGQAPACRYCPNQLSCLTGSVGNAPLAEILKSVGGAQ